MVENPYFSTILLISHNSYKTQQTSLFCPTSYSFTMPPEKAYNIFHSLLIGKGKETDKEFPQMFFRLTKPLATFCRSFF